MVPTVPFPPAMPFTLQFSPPEGSPVSVTVAVKTCAPPVGTFAGFGATDIAMLSSKVTLADPLLCPSPWLTAVTVTLAGDGIAVGAVYSPESEIVPVAAIPPATPFTSHVTAAFELPVTLDWNCCVAPKRTFALGGVTVTVTPGWPDPFVEPAQLVSTQIAPAAQISKAAFLRFNRRIERLRNIRAALRTACATGKQSPARNPTAASLAAPRRLLAQLIWHQGVAGRRTAARTETLPQSAQWTITRLGSLSRNGTLPSRPGIARPRRLTRLPGRQ